MNIYKIAETEELDSSKFEWHTKPEVFNFVSTQFNVELAKQIIRNTPRPVSKMPIEPLRRYITKSISIDSDKLEGDVIDLSIPLIIAQKGSNVLPIDGWHRIAKAFDLGLTELPAVFLTEEETKEIAGN